jgi:ZIP family zinc transporter
LAVSGANIALLGAIAGFTIGPGLLFGRIRTGPHRLPRLSAGLTAVAIGILLFLVWNALTHAWTPIDEALDDRQWAPALQYGLVLAIGLTAGLAGLAHYDRWSASRRTHRPEGPGTASVTELCRVRRTTSSEVTLMIAIGVGLHNLAEGLSLGAYATTGEISLGTLLVVGFALHNTTVGFGIVAPPAARGERPSWSRLLLLGLIGGAPALVGTIVGQSLVNDTVSVAIRGLAAGSILYVVIELFTAARRTAFKELTAWCVALGMLLGFTTDAVVTAAGA